MRNSSGGATVVAAAPTGRPLSTGDATCFGQVVSGSISYATDYATTSKHVVLRIDLTSNDLKLLVKSSATNEAFASIEEAAAAAECTAIAKIPSDRIEYSAEGDNQWAKIS